MTDWLTPTQRTRNMSSIRSRGNATTEQVFVRLLRRCGLVGWRRHLSIPGKPDFTFPRQRVVIFVDGCFWHGCPKCYKPPQDNRAYWKEKITANRLRDRRNTRQLRADSWKVLHIWEHSLRTEQGQQSTIARVKHALQP